MLEKKPFRISAEVDVNAGNGTDQKTVRRKGIA